MITPEQQVRAAARRWNIDPELVLAMCMVESGMDPHAVGAAGEVGIMQVTPAAADTVGVLMIRSDDTVLRQAGVGCQYLRWLIDQGHGLRWAIGAYNTGNALVTDKEGEVYIELVGEQLGEAKARELGLIE